jgi:hypothetical protein
MDMTNRNHSVTSTAYRSGARHAISLGLAALVWIATVAVAIAFGGFAPRVEIATAQPSAATWVSDPAYVAFRAEERSSRLSPANWVSDPALVSHRQSERDEPIR